MASLELLRRAPTSFPNRKLVAGLISKAAALIEQGTAESTETELEDGVEDVGALVDRRWAEEQDAWREGILDDIANRDKRDDPEKQ